MTSGLLVHVASMVKRLQDAYGIDKVGRAFMMWYAVEVLGLDESAAYEATATDWSNDKAIDLFHVDEEAERVIIGSGKYSGRGTYKAKVGELLELAHSVDWLRDPESLVRQGKPDLASAASDYKEAVARGFSVVFMYVYLGPRHKDVMDTATNLNNADLDQSPTRTVQVVDGQSLQLFYEESLEGSMRVAEQAVRIDPAQAYEQSGSYGQALTGTMSGRELKRLYDAHHDALFDRNVRLYLGERKGSVNAGIRETLDSADDRGNFWAYNNGVTVICDRYKFDRESGELSLFNFSVVNGCQTTVSVATSDDDAAARVTIPLRFIAATDTRVVDNIIRFTNSQTPIRHWDITSRDKTQKRLKAEFAKTPNPFFYELRHGESRGLTAEERKRFVRNGKFQSVPYDQLTQFLAAFDGLPSIAYKDKGRLFTSHREDVYPQEMRVEKAMLVWLAAEAAGEAVRAHILEAAKQDQAETVQILKRGAKMFVLAVMAVILERRNGQHYLSNISRAVAGSNNTRIRMEAYGYLATRWYVKAAKAIAARGTADMNQLVRSREYYPRVREEVIESWEIQSMDKDWVKNALRKL
jgi:AIPR protein